MRIKFLGCWEPRIQFLWKRAMTGYGQIPKILYCPALNLCCLMTGPSWCRPLTLMDPFPYLLWRLSQDFPLSEFSFCNWNPNTKKPRAARLSDSTATTPYCPGLHPSRMREVRPAYAPCTLSLPQHGIIFSFLPIIRNKELRTCRCTNSLSWEHPPHDFTCSGSGIEKWRVAVWLVHMISPRDSDLTFPHPSPSSQTLLSRAPLLHTYM